MRNYQKFISKLYIKNFLLIFITLELFFTGMDLLENLSKISSSANLQILYAVNRLLYYVNFTLPLSLVFAMFLTIMTILKSNELVSLYSLGISKLDIIKPIIIISSIITLLYISLNFSSYFVDAYEKSTNIKKYDTPVKGTKELFLKSNDTYAYIDELNTKEKTGKNLKIFITKDNKLLEILEAKSASFANNRWNLKDVTSIKTLPPKLIYTQLETKEVLYGFKPQIIETLFKENTKLTILDSINALNFLDTQNLNNEKVRANLFTMILFPLFAPIAIYGLFFPLPAQRRGTNIGLLSSIYIFSILCIWGILFILTKIASNGTISAEMGIALPIILLSIASWFVSRKYLTKLI